MTPGEQLAQGIAALGLDLPEGTPQRLLEYAGLLEKWNRVYNLTALREPAAVVSHHLLDSLAVLPYLADAHRVADIGSGGGLPGIPIAMARSDLAVDLVESNRKKSAFLQQARIELRLDNVTVWSERVEQWRPEAAPDTVISRAFSDLAEFVRLAGHLVPPGGRLLAMKGVYPYEELAQLPSGWHAAHVLPLQVPGIEAARHLVCIEPIPTAPSH